MKQMMKPNSTESGLLIRSDVAQRLMQPKNYPTALSQEMMIGNVDLWAKEAIEHMHLSGDDIEILQLKLEVEGVWLDDASDNLGTAGEESNANDDCLGFNFSSLEMPRTQDN
ncbi:unnamed protein product [Sphagnum jensenii]|uniref:Uncharacterized protein n=1 Tax=Sphagnum jensenii TaxID=128206 RepID=A0ABP1C1J6_9BRYO